MWKNVADSNSNFSTNKLVSSPRFTEPSATGLQQFEFRKFFADIFLSTDHELVPVRGFRSIPSKIKNSQQSVHPITTVDFSVIASISCCRRIGRPSTMPRTRTTCIMVIRATSAIPFRTLTTSWRIWRWIGGQSKGRRPVTYAICVSRRATTSKTVHKWVILSLVT